MELLIAIYIASFILSWSCFVAVWKLSDLEVTIGDAIFFAFLSLGGPASAVVGISGVLAVLLENAKWLQKKLF